MASMGWAIAQDKQVSGTVQDESGEPVIGASVVVKGNTSLGTVTDLDGKFSMNVPSDAKTLIVRYLGTQEQEVATGNNLIIVLKAADTSLDEVIVVAYGTQKKSSFTGSAATIKSETIEKRKVSNITKALDGVAPGVQVTSGSGQPGSGASVYIRGLGSINASNTPLYVVDGIPYDGNISSISSNDIESVTVLKDASAGALYGARGANGVVMITTKKGKSGVTEVNFKANWGASSRAIPRYATMDSKDFLEAEFSAFSNVYGADRALQQMVSGSQKIFGLNEQYNPYNYSVADLIDPVTGKVRDDAQLLWEDDWLDEVTRNNAFRQEYTLDVSGGIEKAQYLFSFDYLNHDGILKNTDFQRASGRMNVESKPLEWFGAGLGSNFAQTKQNYLGLSGSSLSNVWSSAQLMAPIYPVYQRDRNSNGDFILDANGQKQFDYGVNRPAGQQPDFNSVATLYDDKYANTINNLSGRSHVDFGDLKDGPLQGLKLTFNLGFDYYGLNTLVHYNPQFGNAKDSQGRTAKTGISVFSYTANQMLSWQRSLLENHHLDAMLSHEYYNLNVDEVSAERTGFPIGFYQPSAGAVVTDAAGYENTYSIESYLGRINYDYADKYYFSASFRRDASSRFFADNRWGNFWSVGANYRISNESFLKDVFWLDNLAVRASYGLQGNDNILDSDGYSDYYPWSALYDLAWSNAALPGAIVPNLEYRDLTWEKSRTFNTGVDIALFKRINIGIEWFNRHTTDLLLSYPKQLSSGFSGYNRNSGSMYNRGLEFTVSGKLIKTQDLEWNVTVMGSLIRNKVLKLTDDGKDIISGSTIIREGEPLRSYYVCRSAGVDPATGDQLYWATVDGNGNTVEPYITNETTYAQASRYVAGAKYPDIFGSISTDLKYKSLDFSIAANYSYGGQIIDGVYQNLMSFYYAAQAKHQDMERAWKKPGDVTDIPRYQIGQSFPTTDDMILNASYLSIKNITLGYTLSSKIAKKAGLKGLRVYAAADNVALFTHLQGMNPQYSISGGTDYVYTPERTISLGIDLKF
jgi:TonB-linked SusC/RagA family outer membrane protein